MLTVKVISQGITTLIEVPDVLVIYAADGLDWVGALACLNLDDTQSKQVRAALKIIQDTQNDHWVPLMVGDQCYIVNSEGKTVDTIRL